MNEYEFDLVFQLKNGENPELYLNALFEAGCDDATVSTGHAGVIGLHFTRVASSAVEAIGSAIRNVIAAIPHAKLESAGPDLLNLSELAFEFGCTKQNMSKYATGKMATVKVPFPKSVISGKSSYWHVAQVAVWLKKNGALEISDTVIEALSAIWSLNRAHELLSQPNPEMTEEFARILRQVA